ncbi:hypothetical protein BHM03_00056023 [Ensete ventricosum]|nr:hypothetical protein BHM03_00056023 [Ensete ventricosum]
MNKRRRLSRRKLEISYNEEGKKTHYDGSPRSAMMEKGRSAMAEVQEPLQWRRGKGLLWRKPEIRYGREENKAHYNGEGKKANYNGAQDLLWWRREEGQLRRKPEIHYGREGKKACYGESLRSATTEKGIRHLPW